MINSKTVHLTMIYLHPQEPHTTSTKPVFAAENPDNSMISTVAATTSFLFTNEQKPLRIRAFARLFLKILKINLKSKKRTRTVKYMKRKH